MAWFGLTFDEECLMPPRVVEPQDIELGKSETKVRSATQAESEHTSVAD